MRFKKGLSQSEIEIIEKDLEDLSLKMIKVLKESRDKGIIGEEEYKKQVKIKEGYLNFLREKRNTLFAV